MGRVSCLHGDLGSGSSANARALQGGAPRLGGSQGTVRARADSSVFLKMENVGRGITSVD